MATPPNINHSISLNDAAQLTKNYRTENNNGTKGGFFWGNQVMAMLNNSKSIGMRYYYGLDENKQKVLILTAVDENGNDLCNDTLLELSLLCPDVCSTNNPLNSDV
jgi:hypothetical protein